MFKVEFTAPIEKHDSSLGWYYILYVPNKLIPEFGEEKSPRVKAVFNRKITNHISVKSRGDERFLVVNNKLRKSLGLVLGEEVHVLLEKDESEYGMPMPEELAEMLNQEELAHDFFHNLSPGKQRSLIYMVSQLKNTEPRIKKALGIVEHLIETRGALDFKQLNEKFKEINARFK